MKTAKTIMVITALLAITILAGCVHEYKIDTIEFEVMVTYNADKEMESFHFFKKQRCEMTIAVDKVLRMDGDIACDRACINLGSRKSGRSTLYFPPNLSSVVVNLKWWNEIIKRENRGKMPDDFSLKQGNKIQITVWDSDESSLGAKSFVGTEIIRLPKQNKRVRIVIEDLRRWRKLF